MEAIEKKLPSKRRNSEYFVYDLIDPANGVTFYVGKGTGNRPHAHKKEAIAGKESAKCEKIRAIIDSGADVGVVIVKRFSDEALAYSYESERISAIGLSNLTNVNPGGGGCSTSGCQYEFTDADAKNMSMALSAIASGVGLYYKGVNLLDYVEVALKSIVGKAGFDSVANKLSERGVALVASNG